jgi:adenylate kinase
MHIVLVGPPASGKGTLARELCTEFNIPHIEAGDLLRERAKAGDKLGNEIDQIISKGNFVEESLIFKLITERLEDDDCTGGFLLDGFPRTITQAQSLDSYLEQRRLSLSHVFNLTAPDEELIRRMKHRADKAIRNGGEKRKDDDLSVFFNRLAKYRECTLPVTQVHYKRTGLVRDVDASISIPHTLKQAKSYL